MNISDKLKVHYLEKIKQLVSMRNPALEKKACQNIDELFSKKDGTRKLRIAYVLNHVRVCGGVKILLEHTNHLVDYGHQVTIVCRDEKPEWKSIKADYIQIPPHIGFLQAIPDVDVIVCTVADQVPECYSMQKAPVVLFEQGDTYIYEFNKLSHLVKEYFKGIWSFPIPIIGVSKVLIETLHKNFDRMGRVLPNALDEDYFYPRTHQTKGKLRILYVGQENNTFKGIRIIREALQIVRDSGREFEEVWVTQQNPTTSFHGSLVVNPSQHKLGDIYRSSDIFVSGSYYESFPLPPLEAMSCGCAVVSTNNEGIQEYGINGGNCLLGQIGKPKSLAKCIIRLIDDKENRKRLVMNGYITAKSFRWKNIIPEWVRYLNGTIIQWNEFHQSLSKPTLRIELLPRGLSSEEVLLRINHIQKNMDEEWCLYLIEGEGISEQSIDQIKRMLACGINGSIKFQVIYPDDVINHSILRLEKRLIKRDLTLNDSSENELVIPVQINNGQESYFLVPWLSNIRTLYLNHCFNEIIQLVQNVYSTLSEKERLVATKWLIIALLELKRTDDVINLVNDAVKIDDTYTDILYLIGYLSHIKGLTDISNNFLLTAKNIGPALHYPETFYLYERYATFTKSDVVGE